MALQKIFFYLFLILIPFGTRILVWQFTPGFHEYEAAFIYLSDIILLLFLAFYFISHFKLIRGGNFQFPISNFQQSFKNLKFKTLVASPYFLIPIFLFFAFFSIFFAPSTGLAIYSFARLVLLVLMALAAASVLKEKRVFKTTLAIVAMLAVIQSLIGFAQFARQENLGLQILGEPPISSTDGASSKILVDGSRVLRAYGTFPHPNILSAFLLLGLFSMFYFWLKADPNDPNEIRMIRIIVLTLGIFIILLGLILTFSRAAWGIGILLTLVAIGYWLITKTYRRQALKLLILLLAIGYSLVAILGVFISPRAQISLTEPAVSQRFTYNDLAIELIKENPLGVGIGNQVLYSVQEGIYQRFGMDKVWSWQPIHNIYLLIGAEIGVLGLLSFLIFLALLLISNFQFPIFKQISNSNDPLRPRSEASQKLKRFGILNLENWRLFGACGLEIGISAIMLLALLLFGFADHFLWTIWPGQIMLWLAIGIAMSRGPLSSTDRILPSLRVFDS